MTNKLVEKHGFQDWFIGIPAHPGCCFRYHQGQGVSYMKKIISLLSILFLAGCSVFHPPLTVESYNKSVSMSPKDKILADLKKNSETAPAAVPNSVAVITFEGRGSESDLGLAATEFFTANLNLFNNFNLIDRSYSTILEQEMSQFQPDKQRRTLGAEQLLTGYTTLTGDALNVSLLDMPKDRNTFQMMAMQDGKNTDFFRLVADLDIKFLEKNGVTVSKEMADRMYTVPTENLQAYILYAKGRRAEYAGDYASAKQYYQQAQQSDPGFKESELGTQRVDQQMESIVTAPPPPETPDLFVKPVDQPPSMEEKNVPPIGSKGTVVIDFTLPGTNGEKK
jgi:hypothetical protein